MPIPLENCKCTGQSHPKTPETGAQSEVSICSLGLALGGGCVGVNSFLVLF